jgi:hypothetical protein
MMAAGHPPADWPLFMKLALSVEKDRHAGTMGWSDDVWYAPVTGFLERQHAPAEAQAAFRFMHAIASYDWEHAVAEVDQLQKAREDGIAWINDDLFRDGATVALLHTGNVAKARTLFDRMGEYASRKPDDLRVRLLGAHIAAREKRAKSDK